NPTRPALLSKFTADGCINDATAVVVGATLASFYAYVADGHNGLRVIQLLSPTDGSEVRGFNPTPKPRLIATYCTKGPAVALSEGMPRDRYVDEDGNAFCVFGRRGSRPFNRDELQRMYLKKNGEVYTVTDAPPGPPLKSAESK